jgi:multidrug efflux pump subunit AcrA (membrane-fusion protein)
VKRVLWIPLSVLGGAAVVVTLLMLTRPEATPIAPEPRIPVVQVLRVEPGPLDLVVRAQGTVTPRTESEIRSQLAGEIEWVSPALVSGGFFAAGDPLLRIDPADTRAKLETARAVLARAESELERAVRDRARQRRLAERSVASPARLDEVENVARGAKASVREATARLEIAERDLDRTTVRAPYAGRVRSERVDRGQFVVRGEELARVYAVDHAEIRLPIPDRELRYLDLPLGYREPRRGEAIDGLAPSEGGAAAARPRRCASISRRILRAPCITGREAWCGRKVNSIRRVGWSPSWRASKTPMAGIPAKRIVRRWRSVSS